MRQRWWRRHASPIRRTGKRIARGIPVRILLQIIVPSIKPAIMVVAVFIFMTVWNDILHQTVYLMDPDLATMALGLRVFSGSYGTVWNLTAVATVLSIIPGILVYVFGQKYLVEGIVMTGMKN